MKPRRVLVIDPSKMTFYESTVSGLEDMQKIVGGLIERVKVLENGDELYANEEETFIQGLKRFMFFDEEDSFMVIGPAYIIGSVTSTGNNRDAKTTIQQVAKQVKFAGRI